MKIYTKTGDSGETGLWGGARIKKDATRVQAYGTVDECNAVIGVARAALERAPGLREIDALLAEIQAQLFVVGADLATPEAAANIPRVGEDEVDFLEHTIDMLEAELLPLRQFILPGGTPAAAQLHLARTVCRRAERWLVRLLHEEQASPQIGIYLNRLSDCLFVLARAANARAGTADVPWVSPRVQ